MSIPHYISLLGGVICAFLSIFAVVKIGPRYVSKAQSLGRSAPARNFWFTCAVIFICWMVSGFITPIFFWASLPLAAPTILCAGLDAQTQFLPNILVFLTWCGAIIQSAVFMVLFPNHPLWPALLSGAIAGVVFWLFSFFGIGFGDVKLAPPLFASAALYGQILPYIMLLCLLPGLYAIFIFIVHRSSGVRIAYGPWMVACLPISIILAAEKVFI